MELIIGGAYQGKLDYVKNKYLLAESDIFDCLESEPLNIDKKCYNHFENYVLYCINHGIQPEFDDLQNKIIIMTDIFCGVVPIDEKVRLWREECGKIGTRLASQAASVTRVFCGLPKKLK